MEPVKGVVPEPTSCGFTDTVMFAGAVPEVGVTESQPLLVAVIEKVAEEPVVLVFEITICCAAGCGVAEEALNVNDCGATVTADDP